MKPFLYAILSCGVGCGLTLHAAASEPAAAAAAPGRADVVIPTGIEPDATAKAAPFVPDVYPSEIDAARALGKRWGGSVQTDRATVSVESSSVALTRAFAEGMASANRALRLASTAADTRLKLSVTVSPQPQDDSDLPEDDAKVRGGSVTLTSIDEAGPALPAGPMSERFVEKPWLTDFAGWVTTRRDGRWLLGRSDPLRPALTPSEAARAARQSVIDDVIRVVRSKLPRKFDGDNHRTREVVTSRIVDGNDLVADRFPQSFDRGYGTVFREAVLINASDEALQPLVDEVMRYQRHERNSRARTFFGGLAVMMVTFVLYRLANFVTRGYFTWKLRTVAALVVVGALVVLTHLP